MPLMIEVDQLSSTFWKLVATGDYNQWLKTPTTVQLWLGTVYRISSLWLPLVFVFILPPPTSCLPYPLHDARLLWGFYMLIHLYKEHWFTDKCTYFAWRSVQGHNCCCSWVTKLQSESIKIKAKLCTQWPVLANIMFHFFPLLLILLFIKGCHHCLAPASFAAGALHKSSWMT